MRAEIEGRPAVVALLALIVGLTACVHPINLLFLIPLAYYVRPANLRLLAAFAVFLGAALGFFFPPEARQSSPVEASQTAISFKRFLEEGTPQADLVTALCFADRSVLGASTKQDLERSGIIHLTSASGLQVFVLGWLFWLLLRPIPLPHMGKILLLGAILLFYTKATGFHPSTVRAVLAVLLGDLAFAFGRERDALSALAVAGLLYLFLEPASVFTPGFQISMIIVAGIAILVSQWPAKEWRSKVRQGARFTLVVWALSVPIVAFWFGSVSFAGIPANVAIAPLALADIGLAMGGYGVGLLNHDLGVAIVRLGQPAFSATGWAVHAFGSAQWWGFAAPSFSGYWLAAAYACFLPFWRVRPRPVG